MDKRQFILDTLLPYFVDPSTCGYTEGSCLYRTSDGRKCAFGKHIRDDAYTPDMEGETAFTLHQGGNILTPEATAIGLSSSQWAAIQSVHDTLARKCGWISVKIHKLEEATELKFPELYEALGA